MEGVFLRFHLYRAGEEPLAGDVNGHGVISHDLGLEVVVVNLEGGILLHQGVLAGLDEKIAFLVLYGYGLSGQGQDVLVQLGPQFRIRLLRKGQQGGRQGRQSQEQPSHNTTPSGIKVE